VTTIAPPAGTGSLPAVTLLPLVPAIEHTWTEIRRHHPDVPAAVVTIGTGTPERGKGSRRPPATVNGARQLAAEHIAAEVTETGTVRTRTAEQALAELLHDAAHALAEARDIADTSRQGRYHNTKYRDLAGELGLSVEQDRATGWSRTTATPDTLARYADQLAELRAALADYQPAPAPAADQPARRPTGLIPAVCGCERRIRVAAAVLDLAPITCGRCGKPFTAAP
jgi:hypothetical protein